MKAAAAVAAAVRLLLCCCSTLTESVLFVRLRGNFLVCLFDLDYVCVPSVVCQASRGVGILSQGIIHTHLALLLPPPLLLCVYCAAAQLQLHNISVVASVWYLRGVSVGFFCLKCVCVNTFVHSPRTQATVGKSPFWSVFALARGHSLEYPLCSTAVLLFLSVR